MNGDDTSLLRMIASVVIIAGIPAVVAQLALVSHRLLRLQLDHNALASRVKRVERHVGIDVLALFAMLGLTTAAPGCASHTNRIRDGAAGVRTEASAARADLSAAFASGDVGAKAQPHVRSADARLVSIGELADGITFHVASVQDKGGFWRTIASYIAWALVIVGVVLVGAGFLWAFVPLLVRRLVLWIPALAFLIPRGIADAAKLTLESRDDPSKLEQLIAAKRAASPTFDAMYRTLKRKRALTPAGA